MPKTPISGTAQVSIPAQPDTVWAKMKDYGDLSWTEGVAEVRVRGQGIGMVRSVRLEGSEDWMDEVLLAVDDARRKFDYGIDSGMAGVESYRASGQALPEGDGCTIRWQCSGDVDAAQAEDMQMLMDVMAGEIARLFAAQFE